MRLRADQLTRPLAGALLCALAACAPPAPEAPLAASPDNGLGYTVVPMAPIPDGELGLAIRRGAAILKATRDSLPGHVGNALQCTSCHLDGGRRLNAMPWVGIAARFPQFRSRSATVQYLEDRINDCFERSMSGSPLPWDDPAMRDMIAYMSHLSVGTPHGTPTPGQGLPMGSPERGDSANGEVLYAAQCARCHGSNGEGIPPIPPVWGPESYNIGAGMSRLRTVAAFIRHNMPFDRPGSLTTDEAQDIATWLTTRPRPDYPAKAEDWPRGDPPPDVAYPTRAGRIAKP